VLLPDDIAGALVGAVAVAFIALFDALIAVVFVVVFENEMVLLASVLLSMPFVVTVALQAATERPATAAPTIRIVRSVPEVMSLVPCE
jgi:hypothetical protein